MTFCRRTLLRGLGAAGAAAALPRLASADPHPAEICYSRFQAALDGHPELDPWRSVNVEKLPRIAMTLEGKLPKQLNGTLYRNGPAGFERAGARYQHWFDGDGMVQAFRLSDGAVHHHGRKVRTEKWRREEAAGRFLLPGAGSSVPNPGRARGNDSANPANISVLPWGDELLALWEAGSPYALDPRTLETRERRVWSPATDGMPFSAHPLVESDGRWWNFGLAQWMGRTGSLALYALSPARGLDRVTLVDLPFPGYLHSFTMTERHLVFYLSPHIFDRRRARHYVDGHRWEPKRGGRVLLVDKNDFERRRWLDAPAGFVWHFADAREEAGGTIRARVVWADRPKAMDEDMYAVMCGDGTTVDDRSVLATLTITPSGRVGIERTDVAGEFPVTDSRAASPFVVLADDTQLNVIAADGRSQSLRADGRVKLEEHRFVPRSARPGDGWLVGTGYDLDARRSVLTIFDTQSAGSAPVAVARMDRRIPFGFHGWFAPA